MWVKKIQKKVFALGKKCARLDVVIFVVVAVVLLFIPSQCKKTFIRLKIP